MVCAARKGQWQIARLFLKSNYTVLSRYQYTHVLSKSSSSGNEEALLELLDFGKARFDMRSHLVYVINAAKKYEQSKILNVLLEWVNKNRIEGKHLEAFSKKKIR